MWRKLAPCNTLNRTPIRTQHYTHTTCACTWHRKHSRACQSDVAWRSICAVPELFVVVVAFFSFAFANLILMNPGMTFSLAACNERKLFFNATTKIFIYFFYFMYFLLLWRYIIIWYFLWLAVSYVCVYSVLICSFVSSAILCFDSLNHFFPFKFTRYSLLAARWQSDFADLKANLYIAALNQTSQQIWETNFG